MIIKRQFRLSIIFMLPLFICFTSIVFASSEIFVDTISPISLKLDVESSDTIENVKQKIQDKMGLPPRYMSLYYNGLNLEEGRTLADYNIQRESHLWVDYDFSLPQFNKSSGRIRLGSEVDLNVSIAYDSLGNPLRTEIRYTLDGTTPNAASAIYNSSIAIESDVVIKAATFVFSNDQLVQGRGLTEVWYTPYERKAETTSQKVDETTNQKVDETIRANVVETRVTEVVSTAQTETIVAQSTGNQENTNVPTNVADVHLNDNVPLGSIESQMLPKTSEKSILWVMILGLLFMFFGIFVIMTEKHKSNY